MPRGPFGYRSAEPVSVEGVHAAGQMSGAGFIGTPLGFDSVVSVVPGQFVVNFSPGFEIDPNKCIYLVSFGLNEFPNPPNRVAEAFSAVNSSVSVMTGLIDLVGGTINFVDSVFYLAVWRTAA